MGYAPPRSPDTQPVGVKKRRSPKPGPSHIIDLRPALEAVHVSSARCALAYLPWELGVRPSTPEKEQRPPDAGLNLRSEKDQRSGPPDAGLNLRSEKSHAGERDAGPQKLRVSRICVEDIVSAQIDACDPLKTLPAADFCHVLSEVTDIVVRVMTKGERAVRARPRRC
ncbi:hypothetical protein EMIHUDRAFT_194973 [Emiliania huxleyi CCMP1516]|uniref:Uncharacterized protein n=2 Tax=Emiliania huxleyi TaxID=2903 RepID=A0A0D3JGQ4_EMIH1|nr:hypothetical protein EMIHUDRAFT_194973 [Emiliania huxleyi CCMP1516]EOD22689.1 hypothetical protein EMIHUDRAFT_194973 [Emiliania huxleyi CCMP1516]|eukprot:XP_005775118.1 hypothetical protein EMIHUDRAFT_194973 [Emiliania huxleyi CCMP1516]